jgi:hypothetical protein
MVRNAGDFAGPDASGVYLRARGFDARGERAGGILAPQKVTVPAGAFLVRLFKPGTQYGDWWSTPYELRRLVEHFARGRDLFSTGRAEGRGVLHATLAVLPHWSGLTEFWIAALSEPLYAYYGEGDAAPKDGRSNKPVGILVNGVQRRVRQLYIPHAAACKDVFKAVTHGATDTALFPALSKRQEPPLSFER